MREYRKTKVRCPEQLKIKREYQKKFVAKKRLDPIWLEKNRKRLREYMKKKRISNPEFKKGEYRRHTEWARKNKARINANQRERNKDPKNKLRQKVLLLKKNYGLTHQQYIDKRTFQNDQCPICKKPLFAGAVDHNHSTGQVRDILCRNCNLWVGFMEKSPELVAPMQEYLKRWNGSAMTIPMKDIGNLLINTRLAQENHPALRHETPRNSPAC